MMCIRKMERIFQVARFILFTTRNQMFVGAIFLDRRILETLYLQLNKMDFVKYPSQLRAYDINYCVIQLNFEIFKN